jgi:hypothetical protein
MAWAKYFFKNHKCLAKNLNNLFLFQRFSLKMSFQYAFDDILSVTHVFIKQIPGHLGGSPPFPLPPSGLFRGWGSSGSFQPQAVTLVMAMKQWGLGLSSIMQYSLNYTSCTPWNCLCVFSSFNKFVLYIL